MFCSKCGSMLISKGGKMVCSSCGKQSSEGKIREKSTKVMANVAVAKEEMEAHPKTKEECAKCGNEEAYFWMVQTRGADESPTKFFKCTKCKHTWRDYS